MVRFLVIAMSGDKFVAILTRGDFGGPSFLMSNNGVPFGKDSFGTNCGG